MTSAPTLGGLLGKANARYRVFDLGRRVTKLSNAAFARIEEGHQPYPLPLQQQAWLGILFWDREDRDEHFVWFLRFPLDETGCLQPAARDAFMEAILRSLAERQQADAAIEKAHEESPYAFRPREERLAAFHAHALCELGREPSRFYAHARDYLDGAPGHDQWAFVGLQGLADVAARLGEDGNAERVGAAIPQLPAEPLVRLCLLLENEPLTGRVAAPLIARLNHQLGGDDSDPVTVAALIRALGATAAGSHRRQAIGAALESPVAGEIGVLAAIAGRAWEALADDALRLLFLDRLAGNSAGQEAFVQVLRDLLFLPGMRPLLMKSFRVPGRSEKLARALGEMFGAGAPPAG